jgi:hypothetical protein
MEDGLGGYRLWRRLLKTQAMREQHAVCLECSLPLAFKPGVIVRLNSKAGFVPENVQLIHPECQKSFQREGPASQRPDIQSIAAE